MSKYRIKPSDPKNLKTYSIKSRKSKIKIDSFAIPWNKNNLNQGFLDSIPNIQSGKEFKEFLSCMHQSRKKQRPLLFGLGAHVLKLGLSPILIDMMRRGWITAMAVNGAFLIHDFEIAFAGKTSEDVAENIKNGNFGVAEETGFYINQAINNGYKQNIGMGEAVGKMISQSEFPHNKLSLLGTAYELDIPVTVHVAIGTDITHFHPNANGSALGQCSLTDFFLFCSQIEQLNEGIYCNIGSAVILPEVFLKAISFVRNKGIDLDNFTTAVFDFNKHYRPENNVVKRPLGKRGKGYYFIGHHELMIPLLSAGLNI